MLLTLSKLDSGRSTASTGRLNSFRTLAPLRLGAGLVLLLTYAIDGTGSAWQHIWQHKPWELITTLQTAGIIWPEILSCTAAFLALAVALSWVLGFFTRLFSALLMPVLLFALLFKSQLHIEAHSSTAWLLLFIAITLLLYGSGRFSVDAIFNELSRPKRNRRMF